MKDTIYEVDYNLNGNYREGLVMASNETEASEYAFFLFAEGEEGEETYTEECIRDMSEWTFYLVGEGPELQIFEDLDEAYKEASKIGKTVRVFSHGEIFEPSDFFQREEEGKKVVLMADGCTESDAQRHIKAGALVFDAPALEAYIAEQAEAGALDDESAEQIRRMAETKGDYIAPDWGRVELAGSAYFVEYWL